MPIESTPIESMSIEQHENELKELLTRVMRDPLQPLKAQLEQTGNHVEHVDRQLSTLREVELTGVSRRLDDLEKGLKRLRNWADNDAADELKSAIFPPMQEGLDTVGLRMTQAVEGLACVEQQVSALRELVLGDVCARLAENETTLHRLSAWAKDEAANELAGTILPPVQGALNTLGTRLDDHTASIILPVRSISQELAQAATVVGRMAEASVEARALAVQRDASLGDRVSDLSTQQAEQWRLMQVHVREASDAAVETLSAVSATANAAQQSELHRLVENEVSRRIDKLIILGRWTVGLAVVAVCAASGALTLLIHSLQR